MNRETPNPCPISESALPESHEASRCAHHTRNGRCRMTVADPSSAFCADHARKARKPRGANLSAQLIGDTQEFTSAVTINRSLGELYKLLARDEILPRRAAVMAYTAQLLLRTLPAIAQEVDPDSSAPRIIIDMPRPDRDE